MRSPPPAKTPAVDDVTVRFSASSSARRRARPPLRPRARDQRCAPQRRRLRRHPRRTRARPIRRFRQRLRRSHERSSGACLGHGGGGHRGQPRFFQRTPTLRVAVEAARGAARRCRVRRPHATGDGVGRVPSRWLATGVGGSARPGRVALAVAPAPRAREPGECEPEVRRLPPRARAGGFAASGIELDLRGAVAAFVARRRGLRERAIKRVRGEVSARAASVDARGVGGGAAKPCAAAFGETGRSSAVPRSVAGSSECASESGRRGRQPRARAAPERTPFGDDDGAVETRARRRGPRLSCSRLGHSTRRAETVPLAAHEARQSTAAVPLQKYRASGSFTTKSSRAQLSGEDEHARSPRACALARTNVGRPRDLRFEPFERVPPRVRRSASRARGEDAASTRHAAR